ncbi:Surface layer protein [Bacillus thuringiensis serovar sotto str. T04001]|nr:Surface layer protein [Bacillus thuringiensis serovar sotto str. T04001]
MNIVSDDFEYFPESLENPAVKKQLSTEAQNILKGINNKYHTNLKYDNLLGGVYVLDKNMYLPEGTIGAQFVVLGGANDFKILFLDNNEATVELTKKMGNFHEWFKFR